MIGVFISYPPRYHHPHLSRAESRHGGKDAEGVAREEDDAVRVAPHARRLVVVDVVDGVRHAGVLGLGDVGVVGLAVVLAQRETERERGERERRTERAAMKPVGVTSLAVATCVPFCASFLQAV